MRTRTSIAARVALVVLLCGARPDLASEASVPPRLQASLIARLAPFDRSLVAGGRPRLLLVVAVRRDDAGSQQVAAELVQALRLEPEMAGLPLEVATVEVSETLQLTQMVRLRHPAILFLSTSFSADAPALAASLDDEDVLTIAAESEAVSRGICVGFDLVSGKPRVLIHLRQSKRQHVNFQAALLHLAKVVDQ